MTAPSPIDGLRVLILGLGVAGRSALEACRELGAEAVVVDPGQADADAASLDGLDLASFDLCMASPGFSPLSPELRAIEAAGLEVWSEMEFAWRVRRHGIPWVLVTGTNGKTTTTQMVGAIAAAGGLDVATCGNMGIPVIAAAREQHDLVAVEIASLQLHYTSTLSPHAAVCLNADEDHLDWHGSVEAYRADKARVYRHVQVACVYGAHDSVVEAMVEDADVVEGARAVGVTLGAPAVSQLGIVESLLADRAFHESRRTEALELGHVSDLSHLVAGDVPPYLLFNALAAAALCRAVGVEPAAVARGLASFSLDAHRTAHVRDLGGVSFVDDSKATNAHAAIAAFGGRAPSSVVWIAGGQAKGQEFDELVRAVRDRVRAVVLIGADPEPLAGSLAGHAADIPVTRIEPGDTVMEQAVRAARDLAMPGDTVLLSPACASFDQFRSYADRGDAFAAAVGALEQ
ncbi:UDP-N-acetylmuramoyl-L-alanine--D-glutamate ligase [Demequina activiva]|uniref:UDP-N-acetylmuramoylalanine--D-glutamate ligase n=1 Tax=Demequina activiva TaxID=1582364 RepID=A0A919Q2Y4_9MICO|nr:UDP-N-acetylmuramoyl-L-alanine--D-glutamate ligase [Demequina activiva]GIG54287.1 UDP-N-acetylmuramoylalanine--D-glutamate ligase [Demequina activiva]